MVGYSRHATIRYVKARKLNSVNMQHITYWCLFSGFSSQEFFPYFGDLTTPMKGYKFWPILDTHDRWAVRIFNVRTTTTVTRENSLKWSSQRTRDTHTCYRAFRIGAVTTCFKDMGLSRPGIELRCPAFSQHSR